MMIHHELIKQYLNNMQGKLHCTVHTEIDRDCLCDIHMPFSF